MQFSEHPRLYLKPYELPISSDLPFMQACIDEVARSAADYVRMPALRYRRNTHNEHLTRAREVQGRVVTLLARWKQTGQEKFRRAAIQHVRMMDEWEYWSWIAERAGDAAPDAIFDLSYGENSATLAIAYDCLHDTLSDEERALFLKIARTRSFASAAKNCKSGGSFWFGSPQSNWNTVCAGGLGMLANTMYDEFPEAAGLLPLVDESITPFLKTLDRLDGGWPEGIGYWNYGMRYCFMYLLSRAAAEGKAHPLMKIEGLSKTLSFPLDFCPNGQPCSFGDVNSWHPLPIHYAMAMQLGKNDVMQSIDSILEPPVARTTWPDAAEWLMLHPQKQQMAKPRTSKGVAKLYKGLDWGVLADSMPEPSIYMSVRGGTTKVPHGQQDLLSFQCVVGGEKLITSINSTEYLDTTFSPRREELFEVSPASKNTVFINGVGIMAKSYLDSTEQITLPGTAGFRMDATSAMGITREDRAAAQFCGRLVLMLDRKAFVIIDRAHLRHPGRFESRMHTQAKVKTAKSGAAIQGNKQRLKVAYASNVPAILNTAVPALTTPTAPRMTSLCWCTGPELYSDMLIATVLSPGAGKAKVEIEERAGTFAIKVETHSVTKTIHITGDLRPVQKSKR